MSLFLSLGCLSQRKEDIPFPSLSPFLSTNQIRWAQLPSSVPSNIVKFQRIPILDMLPASFYTLEEESISWDLHFFWNLNEQETGDLVSFYYLLHCSWFLLHFSWFIPIQDSRVWSLNSSGNFENKLFVSLTYSTNSFHFLCQN